MRRNVILLNMNSNTYTCKLPIVGSEFVCILNSEWTNKDVKLLLMHNNLAWSGKFQVAKDTDIIELIDQFSLTEEEFLEETKKALTTHGGVENFTYTIEDDKFTWKKYVKADFPVKFGYVTLSKVPVDDIFEKIIDNTFQSTLILREKLVNLKEQKDTLEKENLLLTTKLSDLINKKNEMEAKLYGQFLLLINEKKKRIVELENKLNRLPDCNKTKPGLIQNDSDVFDSDTELDSEEEEKQSPCKIDNVEYAGSLEIDASIYTLPKRSKQSEKTENNAGPSGCNRRGKNTNNTDTKQKDSRDFPNLSSKSEVRMNRKISGRNNSVVESKNEQRETNNSEEDAFIFPKRSKRITNQIRPSSNKINYDCDDETFLDKTIKLEPNSEDTISQLNPFTSVNKSIKTEQILENKNNSLENLNEVKEENGLTDRKKLVNKEFMINKNNDSEGLSSSTLDMLNQLV